MDILCNRRRGGRWLAPVSSPFQPTCMIAAMSKKRKQNSRRPAGDRSRRVNGARPTRRGEQPPPGSGIVLSEGSSLDPKSCIFYDPEVAVTTFQLSLSTVGRQNSVSGHPPAPILVKACESRFSIEHCGTFRLCTPGYYREDGESLIWDMQEGVMSSGLGVQERWESHCACDSHISDPTDEERWDDPADMQEQQMIDLDMARRLPLAQAMGRISTTSLRVRESKQSSMTYGDSCLIWCCSVKPRNASEWSSWRESLEPSYDHVFEVSDPHIFAQALGAMAFQQKGVLGSTVSFRNPQTGDTADCPGLPVVYGPVVYVDDRQTYIEESSSDVEFIVRSIFTKTSEHLHQREFRFAILTGQALEADTLDLKVSPEMRMLVGQRDGLSAFAKNAQSPEFNGCVPSPRIRRCFPEWSPTHPTAAGRTTLIRSSFHLAGVHNQNTETVRRAMHRVEDVDCEHIEQAIANVPTSSSDARIAKLSLDAGPGCRITLYDLDGIDGTYRLSKKFGRVVLSANPIEPASGEKIVLINNSEFDGTSILDSETNELTLSYTPMNPATTVKTDLSNAGDTIIAVATSEDGTVTSAFEIVFDKNLGINLTKTRQADST